MTIDDISSKIAKDIGLSEVQVQQINRVQWKFLMEIMQSNSFDTVQLFYVGKFLRNQKYDENGRKIRRNTRRLDKLDNEDTKSGSSSKTETKDM